MRLYSSFLHSLPFIRSGLTTLSFNLVTNRQFARCDAPISATLLNGTEIDVSPNDYHGRILYLFGTNDPKVHMTVRGLLRQGDVFLDIGANYSSIGLSAAEWVGPAGYVHLFEPQEAICNSVGAAIARSEFGHVQLHRIALMNRDDEMTISRPKHHSGMATLVDYGGDRSDWESLAVPVRDIATYVPALIEGRSFGVKLDIEGAEPIIMPWLLRQQNLHFLVFEAAHNRRELWDLVRGAGLELFGLCRFVLRSRIRLVDSVEAMSAYHDMVAVRLPKGMTPPRETSPMELGRRIVSHALSPPTRHEPSPPPSPP
jgi:FkbM family methyltransferase